MAIVASFSQPRSSIGDTCGEYVIREVIDAKRGRYRWEKLKGGTSITGSFNAVDGKISVTSDISLPPGKPWTSIHVSIDVIDPGHVGNSRKVTFTAVDGSKQITSVSDEGVRIDGCKITPDQAVGEIDRFWFLSTPENMFETFDATIEMTVVVSFKDLSVASVTVYRGKVGRIKPKNVGRIAFTVNVKNENDVITIPVKGTNLNYDVDWGDGSFRVNSNTELVSHVYTRPGNYTITLSGRRCPHFKASDSGLEKSVISIDEITRPDRLGMVSIDYMWAGCVGAVCNTNFIDTGSVMSMVKFMDGVSVDTNKTIFKFGDIVNAAMAFNGSSSVFSRAEIDTPYAMLLNADYKIVDIVRGPSVIEHSPGLLVRKFSSPMEIDTSGVSVGDAKRFDTLFTGNNLDWWLFRSGRSQVEPEEGVTGVDLSDELLDETSIGLLGTEKLDRLNAWWDNNPGIPVDGRKCISIDPGQFSAAMSTLIGAKFNNTDATLIGSLDETIVIPADKVSQVLTDLTDSHTRMIEEWDTLIERITSAKTIAAMRAIVI